MDNLKKIIEICEENSLQLKLNKYNTSTCLTIYRAEVTSIISKSVWVKEMWDDYNSDKEMFEDVLKLLEKYIENLTENQKKIKKLDKEIRGMEMDVEKLRRKRLLLTKAI